MDTPSEQTMQTANTGLNQKLCLNCQRNPPNPPTATPGQSRGILCRKCQGGVVRALMSNEHPDTRANRIANQERERMLREARAARESADDLYL